MTRSVLVTGGAGFIGSHVVDRLVELGLLVRVLDVATPTRDAGWRNPAADHMVGDIRDAGVVARCLEGVDAVSHHAARVGLGVDMGDVLDYVSANDLGTAGLLLAMHRTGFRGRLVLASSMVVYGEGRSTCPAHGAVTPRPRAVEDLAAGRFESRCPRCGAELQAEEVSEDAPPDPRNVYASTKLHQEHLCAAFAREHGIPLTVLRYHNVYGPRMPRDTPYAGVAAIFRSALAAGRSPQVLEDGRQRRDFVHVRDVAEANALALLADPPVEGPMNVGSGRARTIGEMAAALCRAYGPGAPGPVVTGGFRIGDVRHVVASTERIRTELGFAPAVGFEQGMAELATGPTEPMAQRTAQMTRTRAAASTQ